MNSALDCFKFEPYTTDRAAQELNYHHKLSPEAIRRLCRQGKVKAKKVGGRWIIDSSDWYDFVYALQRAELTKLALAYKKRFNEPWPVTLSPMVVCSLSEEYNEQTKLIKRCLAEGKPVQCFGL